MVRTTKRKEKAPVSIIATAKANISQSEPAASRSQPAHRSIQINDRRRAVQAAMMRTG